MGFTLSKASMMERMNMSNVNEINWEAVFYFVGNSIFVSIFHNGSGLFHIDSKRKRATDQLMGQAFKWHP